MCYFYSNKSNHFILRFIQAVGACSGVVVMRAIVRDLFSHQESAQVFSYLMLVMGIAPIIAPLLGSVLLLHFGWQAIFWFLGVFAILLIMVSYFYLPESTAGDKTIKFRGAFKRYWQILGDKHFLFYSLSGGFAMGGMFVYITSSPFMIMKIFGVSPKNYGWIFAINALGYILSAQINSRIVKVFEIHHILNVVFKILVFSVILLIICGFYFFNLWAISIAFFIYISLVGIITPNSTAIALINQKTNSGSASALLGTIQFVIAAFGAFLVSHFHNQTAWPMILIISLYGFCAFAINKLLLKTSFQ